VKRLLAPTHRDVGLDDITGDVLTLCVDWGVICISSEVLGLGVKMEEMNNLCSPSIDVATVCIPDCALLFVTLCDIT